MCRFSVSCVYTNIPGFQFQYILCVGLAELYGKRNMANDKFQYILCVGLATQAPDILSRVLRFQYILCVGLAQKNLQEQ